MTAETATPAAAAAARKKKNLKRVLWALLALLAILIAALIYYILNQRPVTQAVPGVSQAAPRFVKSVFGNFTDITGVAINKKGDRVYICDGESYKVWIMSSAGKILGSFGKRALPTDTADEGFGIPLSVAVGAKDEVYVADRLGARVQIYGPTGKYIGRFVPKEAGQATFEWSPLGVATDSAGNVYVSDAKKEEHRILKFDSKGNLLMKFGTQGNKNGQFNYPNGLAIDNTNGDIYVCDSNNFRIQVFNKTGKYLRQFGTSGQGALTHPTAISLQFKNFVHVVESFGHSVQVYDKQGNSQYNFGKFGIADGQFRYPKGIAIAPDGTVFVSDHDNLRMQIWKY